MHIDYGNQIGVRIAEGEEVIGVRRNGVGKDRFERVIELFLDLSFVFSKGDLTPAESLLAAHNEVEAARNGAVIIDCDVAGSQQGIRRVSLEWGSDNHRSAGALTNAACAGVPPVHRLEGAHFFAGTEEYLIPAAAEDDNVAVELVKGDRKS